MHELKVYAYRKDDFMKKLLFILFFSLMLAGCKSKDGSNMEADQTVHDLTGVSSLDEYSDHQNDLVYRDYGTGLKLSDNSKLTITQPNLNLKDETATIYAINLVDGEMITLCDYHPNQVISFTPESDGVYQIIAEISNGEIMDLTPNASVVTTYSVDEADGFILLQ